MNFAAGYTLPTIRTGYVDALAFIEKHGLS